MKHKQPKFSKIFAAHMEPEQCAEYASVVWAEGLAELELNGLVTKSRLSILERYALARTEYNFYYPLYAHNGLVGDGPNGGEVFSMKWSALLKLNDQIMKMEDSLLISPKAAGDKVATKKPDTIPTAADEFLNEQVAH